MTDSQLQSSLLFSHVPFSHVWISLLSHWKKLAFTDTLNCPRTQRLKARLVYKFAKYLSPISFQPLDLEIEFKTRTHTALRRRRLEAIDYQRKHKSPWDWGLVQSSQTWLVPIARWSWKWVNTVSNLIKMKEELTKKSSGVKLCLKVLNRNSYAAIFCSAPQIR